MVFVGNKKAIHLRMAFWRRCFIPLVVYSSGGLVDGSQKIITNPIRLKSTIIFPSVCINYFNGGSLEADLHNAQTTMKPKSIVLRMKIIFKII